MKIIYQSSLEFWILPGPVLAIVVICFIRMFFFHTTITSDYDCQWTVDARAGVPYNAINNRSEIKGRFERQPDGAIWLRGTDTPVQDATSCLKKKGFTVQQLSLVNPH
ncbi:hypothetical protein [Candidatus Pantoea formicae]|uniref:hypothetical protein n=1 Tax=Candidatus Pantoea formicae TaxID=2608355 RepID=UPI003EDA6E5A